jgi:hypothetical protein
MSSTESSRSRAKRARLALAAALIAVGCSGGTGGGCGSSCGGAFKTADAQGNPIKYTGSRLDNVAQVRVTRSGFNFLDATHLNDILSTLNGDSSLSQSFTAPAGTNTLSFWYRVVCPGSLLHGWATATLRDTTAHSTAVLLAPTCTNTGSFVQVSTPLVAGHKYHLVLSNHDGNDSAGPTYSYFDDVAVSGTTTADPIQNGGFEGGLGFWTSSGSTQLSNTRHGGADSAQVGTTSPGVKVPCVDAGEVFNACNVLGFLDITKVNLLAGDENFNMACDPGEGTPLHITFRDVRWILDPARSVLKAHLIMHLKTGDIYLRTREEHSSLCNGTSAIQARVIYDDNLPGLPQKNTVADLEIRFSTTPDGRLEFNFDDASLASVVQNFQPAALVIDGNAGNDPAPPASAPYSGNGCDPGSGTYSVMDSPTSLRCAGVFDTLNAGCDVTKDNGGACAIVQYVRGYLFDSIKNRFKDQIVRLLRQQLDNLRCQRSVDNSTQEVAACDATHTCPADDEGHALACDAARGVCYPPAQGNASYNCEPIPLAIMGQMDVAELTEKVGFPPGTKLDVFAGLGSKGPGGAAKLDANGLQLAAQAGTRPATDSNFAGVCVPPIAAREPLPVPPMDFDASSSKPIGVTDYEVGFSLASAMLNRGFLDAYNAGMLCVAVTNKTTAFISSGLFKTFLPSIGLVTGGKDVPMAILLRPTLPPSVRVGRNTTRKDAGGNDVPDDPLLTLSFNKMNLDFYALVDERQVRLFTLQADLKLPLNLRTFPDPNADTLQPVLGGLDTVLTNISALSPDGGAYGSNDMLAEDPGVVKDLLGAAVRLAQPLLAGVIKPIALPSMLGLKFAVEGIAGAVPFSDVAADGYNHLALWAKVNECGTSCEQYTVRTQAKVVSRMLPDSVREIRAGNYPGLTLELSALQARPGARAQFSYRVDGSLWSAWNGNPRLVLRDPLFLAQGHHLVEVVAREAGDDHTMDPRPVAIDFFVSYEAPTVSLAQRPDGAVVTRARSAASPAEKLFFSYRLDGEQLWTTPGKARAFTLEELGSRGLSVSVSDEAGRAAQAHFGEGDEGPAVARAGMAGGCSTSAQGVSWSLLPLLAAALLLRRQRKGSRAAG